MEMPDVIYADLDLGSEDPETPYFAGEYKDGEPVSGKYHHDRIKEQDDATIESLRRENEELKAKLEANEKLMDESADKLIKANAEIMQAFQIMKAKMDKANAFVRKVDAIGQIQAGMDFIIIPKNNDDPMIASTAEIVKKTEQDGEEVIYNIRKNKFFNVGLMLDGKSWVKECFVITDPRKHDAPEQP